VSYTVGGGDTLWRIARQELGDPNRWREIATLNQLRRPDRLVLGQRLFMPSHLVGPAKTAPAVAAHGGLAAHPSQAGHPIASFEMQTPLLPAWLHIFMVADEFNPFTRKLVRKIAYPKNAADLSPELVERIMHPDKYGLTGIDPSSRVGLGLHVRGRTDSRFISTSERALGADRFPGNRFWIDAAKAEAAGIKLHEAPAISKSLDELSARTKSASGKATIEHIRKLSMVNDREVVLEGGEVPASAIKGAAATGITRGFQVVEGIGLIISAYDLEQAAKKSYQQHTVVPLAKESVKQGTGWAGGAVGQTAGRAAFSWAARWAAAEEGAELGGVGGAAIGIETGPGALVSGGVGALVFGTAAFFGAEWATKKLFGGK
jgi:hypothetical protein